MAAIALSTTNILSSSHCNKQLLDFHHQSHPSPYIPSTRQIVLLTTPNLAPSPIFLLLLHLPLLLMLLLLFESRLESESHLRHQNKTSGKKNRETATKLKKLYCTTNTDNKSNITLPSSVNLKSLLLICWANLSNRICSFVT